VDLEIIRYCAEECKRQGSGEVSVYNMCNAWDYMQNVHDQNPTYLDLDLIAHIGMLVEPVKNRDGFRTIPIYVGNRFEMVEKAPFGRIPTLLEMLINSYYEGEPITEMMHPLAKTPAQQFYYDYENIHPFRDGNGRSGKIIYNYLCGTLNHPIMPPNFWGSSNP